MHRFRNYKGRQARLSSRQRLAVFVGSIVVLSGIGLLLGYIVANGLGGHGLDVSGASQATTATAVNQTTPEATVARLIPGVSQTPAITNGPTVTATTSLASSPLPQGEVGFTPTPDPAFIFTFEGSPAPTPGAASAPVAPSNPGLATTSATVSVVATNTITPAPTEAPIVPTDTPVVETSPTPTTQPEVQPTATPTNPPATSTPVVAATTSTPVPTATPTRPTPTVAAASLPIPTATSSATSIPATARPTSTVEPTAIATPTTVAPTATPAPTTVAPGATFTATATTVAATPSVTTTNNPAIRVEYRTNDSQDKTTEISPEFNLVNSGLESVSLSNLTIRYWFTEDGEVNQHQEYSCDYAVVGCDNLTVNFVKLNAPLKGADSYLEIGFGSEAGSLQAGNSSGEIKSRFNKQDWSTYTQSNDYSFDPSKSSFAAWTHATLYYKGTLIWGVEPGK